MKIIGFFYSVSLGIQLFLRIGTLHSNTWQIHWHFFQPLSSLHYRPFVYTFWFLIFVFPWNFCSCKCVCIYFYVCLLCFSLAIFFCFALFWFVCSYLLLLLLLFYMSDCILKKEREKKRLWIFVGGEVGDCRSCWGITRVHCTEKKIAFFQVILPVSWVTLTRPISSRFNYHLPIGLQRRPSYLYHTVLRRQLGCELYDILN